MSLAMFLRKIHYEEEWGFPWNHYAPLFDWAKSQNVRLIGLNRPRELTPSRDWLNAAGATGNVSDLKTRDLWAAGIITDLLNEPGAPSSRKMAVLYGELHLADSHLPSRIREVSKQARGREIEPLAIHQNHESTWWQLARRGLTEEGRVMRAAPKIWCVFTAPPWSRTQALLRFAEEGDGRLNPDSPLAGRPPFSDLRLSSDEQVELDSNENHFDALGQIARWHSLLAKFLNLPEKNLSRITLRTLEEESWFKSAQARKQIEGSDLLLMRRMVRWKLRFLDRRTGIAWLPELSENALSETAAIALFDDQLISTHGSSSFERLFLIPFFEYAFGFLGSLIINPRRKCELPGDHLRRLSDLQTRTRLRGIREAFPGESLARRIALDMGAGSPRRFRESIRLAKTIAESRSLPPSHRIQILRMAARWSGRILAAKSHVALSSDQVDLSKLKSFFLPEIQSDLILSQPHRGSEDERGVRLAELHDCLRPIQLPRSKSDWF
jgi:hypothetical protein